MERYEAGLVLSGTEVKAARSGKIQLKDSFAEVVGNEAWLMNAHISQYSHGNRENHEPVRRRKLLLHRAEIDKLLGKTREKGLTLIPTKIYLKNGRIKCELAVGKGKKMHDKRESERKREMEAEAQGVEEGAGAQHALVLGAGARDIGQRIGRVRDNQDHGLRHGVHHARHQLPIDIGIFVQKPQPALWIVAVGGTAGLLVHAGGDHDQRGAGELVNSRRR